MNDGINGAVALFVDDLTRGASTFFSRYEETGHAKIAREIHAICTVPVQSAGGEFRLVDQVAELLGAKSWFYWKDDPGTFEILEKLSASDHGGITNPALLKRKSSKAVPSLLAALRRFDTIEEETIKKLTLEAALLGQEGIDYADGAKRHRLKTLPGELLSGLEVMCFLYAGLKRIAPMETDTGFDLNDEFAMALELYHAENER